mgnify:CR=1 FL=1
MPGGFAASSYDEPPIIRKFHQLQIIPASGIAIADRRARRVLRHRVSELPLKVTLTDAMAMMPAQTSITNRFSRTVRIDSSMAEMKSTSFSKPASSTRRS